MAVQGKFFLKNYSIEPQRLMKKSVFWPVFNEKSLPVWAEKGAASTACLQPVANEISTLTGMQIRTYDISHLGDRRYKVQKRPKTGGFA